MYNYTIICYGIKIPEDLIEIFEDYIETNMLINPYNGDGNPEYALGIEVSDTDFNTDFINDILSFDKIKTDEIYQQKINNLISSISEEKDELIRELQLSEKEYKFIIDFLYTKPELIRLYATS